MVIRNDQHFNWELSGTVAPGGTVLKLVGDEAGRLWLAAPAGLFYRHEAGWQAVRRGLSFWRTNSVAVHGRHLWVAGMPGGIMRSANGGQSWHTCWIEQTDASVVAIAPSPHFGQDRVLLAAADGDGILRSTDGGRHWELSNFGLREFAVLDVVMAEQIGRYEYAFAITENGFYQSPNGGRAWRRMEMGEIQPVALVVSPNFAEDRVVCVGTEAGELFVSKDAGNNWQLVSDAFDTINALSFAADNSLHIGTMSGVHHLENWDVEQSPILRLAQRSWAAQDRFSSLQSPVLSLADVEGKLYAGLVDGLCISEDNGRSWQSVNDLAARRFVWFVVQTAVRWLVAGPEEEVWRTADGGQTWQPIWSELPVLAVAATAQQIWISTLDELITSSDDGKSWQVALDCDEPLIALAVVNDVVWAGNGAGQIWRAVGGEWKQVNVPFVGQQLVGLIGQPDQLLAVVWSAESKMLQLWQYAEGDNWHVWFSQAAGAVLPQVAVNNNEGAIVGLGSYVYCQTETGWQRRRVGSADSPVTAVCVVPGRGWITAVTNTLLYSADGLAWQPIENDLQDELVMSLQVIAEKLVAGTSDGMVWISPL